MFHFRAFHQWNFEKLARYLKTSNKICYIGFFNLFYFMIRWYPDIFQKCIQNKLSWKFQSFIWLLLVLWWPVSNQQRLLVRRSRIWYEQSNTGEVSFWGLHWQGRMDHCRNFCYNPKRQRTHASNLKNQNLWKLGFFILTVSFNSRTFIYTES